MSGSNAYSPARDLTAKQPARGEGMAITLAFLCGHKSGRAGALMRGKLPMKCAACVKGKA